jgi:hypothetical protein
MIYIRAYFEGHIYRNETRCRNPFNMPRHKLHPDTVTVVLGNQNSTNGLLMSHEVKNACRSGTKFLMTQTFW